MHHNSRKLEETVINRKSQDDICGFNLLSFLNELSYNSGIGRKLKLKPSGFYREKINFPKLQRNPVFAQFLYTKYKKKVFFYKYCQKTLLKFTKNAQIWLGL